MKKKTEVIKRNKTAKVSISLDNDVLHYVKAQAQASHVTPSRWINMLIWATMFTGSPVVGVGVREKNDKPQ